MLTNKDQFGVAYLVGHEALNTSFPPRLSASAPASLCSISNYANYDRGGPLL